MFAKSDLWNVLAFLVPPSSLPVFPILFLEPQVFTVYLQTYFLVSHELYLLEASNIAQLPFMGGYDMSILLFPVLVNHFRRRWLRA